MSRKKTTQKGFVSQETLLNLLKLGGIISVALIAPNALQIVKPFLKNEVVWTNYYPSSLTKTVNKLWRKGFVEIIESKNGQEVKLSRKGEREILRFNLNTIEIKVPARWDGKWRIVFFDISEKRKYFRDFFSKKLKSLNFYLMQDSVFIHPFPCDKEIKFLREVLNVPHEVKIGTLDTVDNAEDLKIIFKNQLSRTKI